MRCVSAQEGRDVSGAGQLLEATLFYGFEIVTLDPQALLDVGQSKAARFALIAQQTTDRAAR